MPRTLSITLVFLLAAVVGSCGDEGTDDGTGPSPTAPPSEGAAVEPDSASDDAADDRDEVGPAEGATGPLLVSGACSLLDAEFLAATVTFEFGESVWEEQADPTDPDRCRWFNESKLLTLTVQVASADQADLDGRRADPPSTGSNEELDVAPGAFAVRDDFGERYYQAWIPLGDLVISVIADVMQLDDAQFVAIAGEVTDRAGA